MYSLSFLFISHVVLITINIILIYQWQPHYIYVSVFVLQKVLVKFASHHRHTIMENTNVAEVVFSGQSRIFGTLCNIHLLYSPPIDCRRIKRRLVYIFASHFRQRNLQLMEIYILASCYHYFYSWCCPLLFRNDFLFGRCHLPRLDLFQLNIGSLLLLV